MWTYAILRVMSEMLPAEYYLGQQCRKHLYGDKHRSLANFGTFDFGEEM